MSLDQARAAVSFPLVVPAALGEPDRVTVAPDRRLVTMQWNAAAAGPIHLDQIGGSLSPYYVKQYYDDVTVTVVDGGEALWFSRSPGQDGNVSARHHRSPDPAALTSLLQKLGLIHSDSAAPVAEFVPAAADSADPTAGTAGEQAIVEPNIPATAAGWWLLGGLVAGIVACVLTVRYVPAVRSRVLAGASASEPDRPGDEPVRMEKLPV